jgi:hypothetical protein
LIAFHFAQLRRLSGRCIDTNQAEYGVMPFLMRTPIYGRYIDAIDQAAKRLAKTGPTALRVAIRPRSLAGVRRWIYAVAFGTVWVRLGRHWYSGGFGFGRHSGQIQAWQRRWRGRTD